MEEGTEDAVLSESERRAVAVGTLRIAADELRLAGHDAAAVELGAAADRMESGR